MSSEATVCIEAIFTFPDPLEKRRALLEARMPISELLCGHGTLQGGMTFSPGKIAQAFEFNGSDAGVKIPAAASLDVGKGAGLTIDLWVRPSDVFLRPLVEWNPGGAAGTYFWIGAQPSSGSLDADLVDVSGNHHVISTPQGVIATGAWQHVAVTYDKPSGIATLYVNGSIAAGPTSLGSFTPQTSYDLYFGSRAGSSRYIGEMDEIQIFSRALSAAEIQAIYDAGSSGICPPAPTPTPTPTPVVPDYAVTTGSVVTVTDVSGNSDTLVISQPDPNSIQFDATGRTFSIDGGPAISNSSGPVSLIIAHSVTVNAGAGDDTILLASNPAWPLPSMTLNGGTGNDTVQVNSNAVFAPNNNLDIDLQNDDLIPGTDDVNIVGVATFSGSGSATIRTSRSIYIGAAGGITTENGNIILEANEQGAASVGSFSGIQVMGPVQATGAGLLIANGRGGNADSNYGVYVLSGGSLKGGSIAGATTIAVNATGGTGGAHPHGLDIEGTGIVSSFGGNVEIAGNAGLGTGSDNYGVIPVNGGTITSGGNGNVTVTGHGGTNSAGANIGVIAHQGFGTITSGGNGNVVINGYGGPGPNGHGIELFRSGRIMSGGAGIVTLNGTGSGSSGHGIAGDGNNSTCTVDSGGGLITYNGTGAGTGYGIWLNNCNLNGSNVADQIFIADTMLLDGGSTLITNYGPHVTLRPKTDGRAIDLGGADSGSALGLSNSEINRIPAGTITLGDGNTGDVTVTSDINRNGNLTTLNIDSGANISISGGAISNIGDVNLTPGGSVFAHHPGTDIGALAHSTNIASGKTLSLAINGPNIYTGYDQFSAAGAHIDISDVTLEMTGSYVPQPGDQFILVNNDTPNPIIGTFTGLPEGTIIPNFRGSGYLAQISYVGGDGNDAVITVASTAWFDVNSVASYEGDSGTKLFTFTVTRNGNPLTTTSVDYETVDNTATSPSDFAGIPPTTLTFAPTETTKTLDVTVNGDTTFEPDEKFYVHLTNPAGAILGNSWGMGMIMNDDCTPPPPGMVAWWPGDDNANDILGSNNGTFHGTAAYSPGKVGQAFSFDGTVDNYVEIPNSAAFNPTGAFSVDGWFYIDPAAPGNAGEIATLVGKTEGSTGDGWALYFDDRFAPRTLKWALGAMVQAPDAIPTAGWYHIAGTFDPAASPRAVLYVNGSAVADSGTGTWGITGNSYPVRIGAMNWTDTYAVGNDRLNGKADEVEFFSRALSQSEIQSLVDAGSGGKCKPDLGKAYVPNGGDETVSVIDISSNAVATTIPTGANRQAYFVAVSNDGKRAYIPHVASGEISVIDTASNTLVNTFSVSSTVHGLAVSLDGTKLYAAERDGSRLWVLDASTGASLGSISVGSNPFGVATSPDGIHVYAANYFGGSVSAVNTTDSSSVQIPTGSTPYGVAVKPDATRVYVTNYSSDTVSVIDAVTNTKITDVTFQCPTGVAVNRAGTEVYVGSCNNNVMAIDTATNVGSTIPVGEATQGISVSQDGSRILAAGFGNKNVVSINASNNAVTTIPVGNNPFSLGVFIAQALAPVPPPTPTPTPTPTVTPTPTPTPMPTPVVQFTVTDFSGDESGFAAVNVYRAGDTSVATDITFDTIAGGTATPGSACSGAADYVSVVGQNVHFAAGDSLQEVDVPLCGDTAVDPNETIHVQLSNPSAPAQLGSPSTAIVTINDTAAQYRDLTDTWFSPGTTSTYPAQIVVSGAPTSISNLRVTLYGLWAVSPENLDVLLVGPQGQKFVLMSDCAGTTWSGPATLTFEDWAANFMDHTSILNTGPFKPTTWTSPVTDFPAPAPAGPYVEPGWTPGGATLSSTFSATNPNGTWSLYLRYVSTRTAPTPIATGEMDYGWGIQFLAVPTAANVGVSGRVLSADGRPIRNARVTFDDSSGHALSAISNSFGYYNLDGVQAGGTYLISANARGYAFTPRVVSVRDDLTKLDITALP